MDDPRSVLSIGDLNFVVSKLERNDFPEDRWNELGLKLHISQPKLDSVRADNPLDVKGCLRRCLILWLQQSYDVDKYGLPTMQLLATVVEEMGLGAVAIKIGKIEGPEGPLLQISDLEYVFVTLNEVSFPPTQWIPLGLALGLDHQTLEAIKANDYRNIDQYLRECLSWWLQRFDDVDAKEKPKMTTLCDALERIGQKAVAAQIRLKALDQKLASPIQAVDDEASSPGFGSHFLKEGIYKEIQELSYEINESNIMLKEELDAAKKKIAELEEKLDTAEKELYYTAEKAQIILRKELDAAKIAQIILRKELDAAKIANIILREELDAAKKEIAELEEKLHTAGKEIAKLKELDTTKKPAESMSLEPEDLNQPLENDKPGLLLTAIFIVFLSFIIFTNYGQGSFIAPLPGVEVTRSTNVVVPGGISSRFHLEEFGLIIVSPSDAIPAGLFSVINIRLSVAGPYVYPDNHTMAAASPVYWLSSSKEFLKPLQLGIRHYASEKAAIKVYTADDNPRNMSYIFEEVANATVSGNYVYFSADHFSGDNLQSDEVTLCGSLHCDTDNYSIDYDWKYKYVIGQCWLELFNSTNSNSDVIKFEENSTKLELDIWSNPSQNWEAVGNFPLVCYKEDFQKFNIRTMRFTLQWKNWFPISTAENLYFPLKGALSPEKILVETPSLIRNFWQRYTREIISFLLIIIICIFFIAYYFFNKIIGFILCLLMMFLLAIVLSCLVIFLLDSFFPEITRGPLMEPLKQLLSGFSQFLQGYDKLKKIDAK